VAALLVVLVVEEEEEEAPLPVDFIPCLPSMFCKKEKEEKIFFFG